MVVLARIETVEDARRFPRKRLRLSTSAAVGRRRQETVLVHDISPGGLLIETNASLNIGDELAVDLPERQGATAEVVWNSGYFYGCRLADHIPPAVVSAALLRSSFGSPVATDPDPVSEEEWVGHDLSWQARARAIIAIAAVLWGMIIAAVFAVT